MPRQFTFVDSSDITAEQAAQIRVWRVENEMSWRAVAQAAADAWGSRHGGNQLFGRELCCAAAEMLGENPDVEPWA